METGHLSQNTHTTRDFLKIGLSIIDTSPKPGEMLNAAIFQNSTCGSVTFFSPDKIMHFVYDRARYKKTKQEQNGL